MCKQCGCEEAHTPAHGVDSRHSFSNDDTGFSPEERESRTLRLETKLLARNDEIAAWNRAFLEARRIVALNIISSPGSGKTCLIERTLDELKGSLNCAIIAGDPETDNDARRLRGKGAPVFQIETGGSCHLSAEQVGRHLPTIAASGVRLLIIENVGNLVCPAVFDLGEQIKVALLSVTEGEDKPLKYPVLFTRAPVVVITKTDLLPHLEWEPASCYQSIRAVRPDARIMEVSARTGVGLDEWFDFLKSWIR